MTGQRALALIILAPARTQKVTSVLIPDLSDNSKPTASSAPSLAKPLHRSLSPQTYNLPEYFDCKYTNNFLKN